MAWDDDKSAADDPENPQGNEQITADEWDDHVADQKNHSSRHESGGSDVISVAVGQITSFGSNVLGAIRGSSIEPDSVDANTVSTGEQQITGELDRAPGSDGGFVVILGGHSHYPALDQSNDDIVLLYDIKRDEYQYLEPMIYGRSAPVAVEYNGYIWVFGGDTVDGTKVERYDLSNDTWEEMPSLNVPRETRLSSNGVVIDGKAYICGGGEEGGSSRYTDVEEYDLESATVTQVASMPATHSFAMQAAYNGYLWLVTGNSDEVDGGHIQRYDPSTDTWDGPSNFSRHPYNATDLAGTQVGNEFHTIGGWDTTSSTTPVPAEHWKYLFDTDEWVHVRDLDGPYSHGKMVWDGTYLWRFQGRTELPNAEAWTNSAWRYHVEEGVESTAQPAPLKAHNMTALHIDQAPYGRY